MQLLLMAQKEVAARKASCTLWAFERLLFGMRSLVTLEML